MNTWPGGVRHAMLQSDHEKWNSSNYPGTLQLCVVCEEPTGSCEEDSRYTDAGVGPCCATCVTNLQE